MLNRQFIHKIMPKALAAAMSLTILCGTVGVTAYSAGAEQQPDEKPAQTTEKKESAGKTAAESGKRFSKEETVYVIAQADGTPDKVIVSDWIKNPSKAAKIPDQSDLSDIENTKGDETYTINENNMVEWDADGSDVYYKGNSNAQLPVGVSIQYALDGKAIAPKELAGKSGKLKMTFRYTNRRSSEVKINGKTEKMYVPFTMLTGMMLDNEKFSNVTVTNGKVINDGTHTFVAGFAFPGLQEDLGIKSKDLTLPASVEVTADVKDFELATTLTVAANDMFSDIDTTALSGKEAELKGKLTQVTKGMTQLCDGSSKLYQGLGTLLNKSDELIAGVEKLCSGAGQLKTGTANLDSGAKTLNNGAAQLDNGVASLQNGAGELDNGAAALQNGAAAVDSGVAQLQGYIGTLSGGLSEISANSEQLKSGAGQVFRTLLSAADTQIAAAGLSAEPMTIENYTTVLNGLISQLDDDSVQQMAYTTARNTVTATVNSQRELIRQAVAAGVRAQVVNGVVAEAGLSMDADTYEAAAAAGQIPEDVQAQISAAITAQMAAMDGTIDANTDAQIASLIETNMQSEEVQTQIAQAVAKAASGRQSLQALKTQLDSYNTFYQGVINYTAGVDQANAGAQKILGGTVSLKNGTAELAGGASELKSGTGALAGGTQTLKNGSGALKEGTVSLRSGAAALDSGALQLYSGLQTLNNGSGALVQGVRQLNTGSQKLDQGLSKFKKEGVDAIAKAVNGDLTTLSARFKAMIQLSKQYQSFTGLGKNTDGKVNFVFKTDSIKPESTEE